jgi:hypothetical protein
MGQGEARDYGGLKLRDMVTWCFLTSGSEEVALYEDETKPSRRPRALLKPG